MLSEETERFVFTGFSITCNPHQSFLSCRKARSPEATLVWGGEGSGRRAPNPKHHWAQSPCEGGLRALSAAVPPAGQQPPRLAGDQVLLPQPHPAAEEEPAPWERAPAPHRLLRGRRGRWCVSADRNRFSYGTLLSRRCTNFQKKVLNFTLLFSSRACLWLD